MVNPELVLTSQPALDLGWTWKVAHGWSGTGGLGISEGHVEGYTRQYGPRSHLQTGWLPVIVGFRA